MNKNNQTVIPNSACGVTSYRKQFLEVCGSASTVNAKIICLVIHFQCCFINYPYPPRVKVTYCKLQLHATGYQTQQIMNSNYFRVTLKRKLKLTAHKIKCSYKPQANFFFEIVIFYCTQPCDTIHYITCYMTYLH